MRAVIQRVAEASVEAGGRRCGEIGAGMLILVGFCPDDTADDVEWTARKASAMRIFGDAEGVMNLAPSDVGADVLVVSQFTLMASCRKGNRPSWHGAAKSDVAMPLYELFCRRMGQLVGHDVQTGEFGADMKVRILNDGPVTILLDSKEDMPYSSVPLTPQKNKKP